jgi:hypothetical protein
MNGTDFRLFYEDYARDKLAEYLNIKKSAIKHLSKINSMHDFDLEYLGIKYDVKTSNPVLESDRHYCIWDFSLRKLHQGKRLGQKGECDFFLLVGMRNGLPSRIFLVPSKKSPTNHIRISLNGKSKYNQYLIFTCGKL